MKKLLLGLFLISSALTFSARVVKSTETVLKDNLIYVGEETTPYTGVIETYNEQGILVVKDEFKNGLDFENFVKLKKFLIEIKKDTLILLSGHDIQYIEFSDEIFKLDNMKLEKIDKQKLYEEIEKIG